MVSMNIGALGTACTKHKNRWLFKIKGVADDGTSALPPSRGARPNFSFKEMEVPHLNETMYFPCRPDLKTVALTLFDIGSNSPVYNWLKLIYDPESGDWNGANPQSYKKDGQLLLYNGCGVPLEQWEFEGMYPQTVDFGELDMANAEIVFIDLTLRCERFFYKNYTSGRAGGTSGFGNTGGLA